MKTVGKQLQDARLAKGWSPELAARETKIRVDRLNELEADDYTNFSSPTYARGFVRTYARSLGLDEYKILRQLDNKLPEDDNASFANDTGIPYRPEASKVAKPFEVGRGVYIAAAIGATVLLLIGFILVQTYRAGYFAEALPATMAMPVTNAVAVVPDDTTTRAMPADSNAPPVALPVDPSALAAAPAGTNVAPAPVAAQPVDTNAAPRALPVDLNALAASSNAPVAVAAVPDNANGAVTDNSNPATATDTSAPPVTPLNTTTPPRAQAVDLNALAATPSDNASVAPVVAQAPKPHAPPALSARAANARPQSPVVLAQDVSTTPPAPAPAPVVDSTAKVDAVPPTEPAPEYSAAPQVAAAQTPSEPPPVDAAPAPSSLEAAQPTPVESAPVESAPAPAARDSTSALTGGDRTEPGEMVTPQKSTGDKNHGKRLVLTASHDSFVRVVALGGPNGDHVRYSSMLHSGDSISFNDRKYTINVGNPAAVDIALDGINYGPHSDHSDPDTFTVESHQP
jgi:cytoskeleton protein RodZ